MDKITPPLPLRLIGLKKALSDTLDFNYRGPSFMNIDGHAVYKVTILSVGWLIFSFIEILFVYGAFR